MRPSANLRGTVGNDPARAPGRLRDDDVGGDGHDREDAGGRETHGDDKGTRVRRPQDRGKPAPAAGLRRRRR
ncbi:MAG: hypothetical protein Kow00114_26940 [Kiloniellaceae bacterium]